MERTLVLIKPHALERGFEGEIYIRLARTGLQVIGLKLLVASQELASRHYAEHEGKDFFEKILGELTAGPLIAIVLEGEADRTIKKIRQVVGSSDPLDALPGTIRGDFASSEGLNLVHASSSPAAAKKEIELWFAPHEIFSHKRAVQDHITRPN